MSAPTRRAVFIDRDGVLNTYLPGDYVKTPAQLHVLPGVGHAIHRLNDASIPVVLVSNQQGVGKGVMSQADLDAVTETLKSALARDDAHLDAIEYCTSLDADCDPRRKPSPGMILDAAEELGIDVAASTLIGDTPGDARAARAAGVGAFVLVLTGQSGRADAKNPAKFDPAPDKVCETLSDAIDWVLGR